MLSKFIKPRQSSVVGIDISSAAVKLLELARVGQRYRVESYAVTPLPSGAVEEKLIKDVDAVAGAVAQTVTNSRTTCKQAAVAVSDSSVITKVIQMDADLNDEDIENQIAIEADKYIPYPLDEVSLDFDVLGPSAKNAELVDVLIVASRSENVHSRVSSIDNSGVDVSVVDVESYAMERACSLVVSALPEKGQNQTIAIIDIGSSMTNLTVLYNLSTVFTREEVFGGQRLTEDIQRHYGLTYDEAGIAKKQGNMPDDYEAEVLGPFKESAVIQVRRALQFFFSASQQNKVNHIILAGGTVNMPGFASMIEEQIGIKTTIANPFADMLIAKRVDAASLAKDASALMICCGLAMRSFTERN